MWKLAKSVDRDSKEKLWVTRDTDRDVEGILYVTSTNFQLFLQNYIPLLIIEIVSNQPSFCLNLPFSWNYMRSWLAFDALYSYTNEYHTMRPAHFNSLLWILIQGSAWIRIALTILDP